MATAEVATTYHPIPQRPLIAPPPGAWDTHFHVWGDDPREKRAAHAPKLAGERAPIAALNEMHRSLGIERGVLVQSLVTEVNYDILVDTLGANPRLRGVALIDERTTDADLERLSEAGVCGARFNFVSFLRQNASLEVFRAAIARIAPLGWHAVLHLEPSQLAGLSELLISLPLPVVLDHTANIDIAKGLNHAEFETLLALQRREHIWIKLGNADRWSRSGPPRYEDAVPFGRALVANDPERLIWCSDWPHSNYTHPDTAERRPPPNDADLLDLLAEFAPDEQARRKILVDNPGRLYAFPDRLRR